MLALAKREVVADRVDTLVKVGLGNRGKVRCTEVDAWSVIDCAQNDLALARYTCVALQRLNGSAKKVKGKKARLVRLG